MYIRETKQPLHKYFLFFHVLCLLPLVAELVQVMINNSDSHWIIGLDGEMPRSDQWTDHFLWPVNVDSRIP